MRIRVIGIIVFILLIFLAAGLFYLQVIRGPLYQDLSARNRIRLAPIEGVRGRIFDRRGTLLVNNRIAFNVAVIPQELKEKEIVFGALSKKLKISEEKLHASLKNNFVAPFLPVKIAFDIGSKNAIMLEEERLDLPGVVIEAVPQRDYIYGKMGSHIFGYLGKINSRELARLKSYGYTTNDLIGKAGIEKFYDNYLKGRHGGMQVEVNNRGRQVGILGIREPAMGKDLSLTIDLRLQEFIEEIMQDARGAVCVVDPADGQVLSLVSTPSFDPNLFVSEGSSNKIRELFKRSDYPMLNRLIGCEYPPGSVFKVVTASAGLEKKKISPERELFCDGDYTLGNKTFKCWKKKGHGGQVIREAIKNSCNVFFYQLGRSIGPDDIAAFANRFGFGRPTTVDLPDEASGLVPNKMWKLLRKREQWYKGETLNYAIGQGYLLVTPIQILRMVSAVANGGYLIKPYLVKRIEDVDISQIEKKYLNISEETLKIVGDGLRKVVSDQRGTGRKAAVDGVVVAGKTGTAQTSTDKTHAWFTGYAPADDPKAALVVFLEYGGKGGLGASKTAGQIFAKLKELGYL